MIFRSITSSRSGKRFSFHYVRFLFSFSSILIYSLQIIAGDFFIHKHIVGEEYFHIYSNAILRNIQPIKKVTSTRSFLLKHFLV